MIWKLVVQMIMFIIGLSMVLYTTKRHADKEGHKPYGDRLDYTGFQIAMVTIGSVLSIVSFAFSMVFIWMI